MLVLLGCGELQPLRDVWGTPAPPSFLSQVETAVAPPPGAGAPPTDLEQQFLIEPLEVEFLAPDLGEAVTETVALHNGGPHTIDIFDAAVDDPGITVLTGVRGDLQPGETVSLVLRWVGGKPVSRDASVSIVLVDDAHRTAVRSIPIHTRVFDMPEGELEASSLDAPLVGIGCDHVTRLELHNRGRPPLDVTGLVIGGRSDTWHLTLLGGGEVTYPIKLPKFGFHPFELHFVPTMAGEQTARISAQTAGPGDVVVPVEVLGRGYADVTQVDEFTAYDPPRATALLAVNAEALDELRPHLPEFFEALADQPLPWRLAFVTRVDGAVDGDVPYIDESFSVAAAVAAARGMLEPASGDNDLLLETLEAAETANAAWLLDAGAGWDLSRLHLVAFNADQEQSTGSVPGYVSAYRAAKPATAEVRVDGFAGTPPTGCATDTTSAEPAEALYDAAALTGGLFWDWCQPWDEGLASLASALASSGAVYTLSWAPDPAQTHVFVDDVEVTEGWTVDTATQQLRFDDGAAPADGSAIRVEYRTSIECHDG